MTDRGDRRIVLEVRVGEDRALGEQPLEPAGEVAAEPGQVVVPELVDRDEENSRICGGAGFGAGACGAAASDDNAMMRASSFS